MFSLIIPVYNEEKAIKEVLLSVYAALSDLPLPFKGEGWGEGLEFEIIVVNDGSTDSSREIAESLNIPQLRVISHERNLGNGAAICTGVRSAKGDIIGTIDADGTYPPKEIPAMLRKMREAGADMIVGNRKRTGSVIPFTHWVAKGLLKWFAGVEAGRHIPDLNSGLRLVRRDAVLEFSDLYPKHFSLHTVLTVAMLRSGQTVVWHPIPYYRRVGFSKLSGGIWGYYNFCKILGLIFRTRWYVKREKHLYHLRK